MSEITPLLGEDVNPHLESYEVLSNSSVSSVEATSAPQITGRIPASTRHPRSSRYGMVSSDSATGLEGTLKRRRRTYEVCRHNFVFMHPCTHTCLASLSVSCGFWHYTCINNKYCGQYCPCVNLFKLLHMYKGIGAFVSLIGYDCVIPLIQVACYL
jgi:hypothetical protein